MKNKLISRLIAIVTSIAAICAAYPLVCPGDPVENLKENLKELQSGDLSDKAEAMEELPELCITLKERATHAQEVIVETLNTRYKATVASGRDFEEEDLGLFLDGLAALKYTLPHSAKTKSFLQEMANNSKAWEAEYIFKNLQIKALKVYGAGVLFETKKTIAEAKKTVREAQRKFSSVFNKE